jgi:hypothetical protein
MIKALLDLCKTEAERLRTEAAIEVAYNAGRNDQRSETKTVLKTLGIMTEDDV